MTRNERLRRCLLLCAHFASNVAYYRARRVSGQAAYPGVDFWDRTDANFLDTAVLEWCKLFGDPRAEHAWQKIVADPPVFEATMLAAVGMSRTELADLVEEYRRYRDKFLAHLDSDLVMQVPHLEPARKLVWFYYAHVWTNEIEPAFRGDAPADLETIYQERFALGTAIYTAAEGAA